MEYGDYRDRIAARLAESGLYPREPRWRYFTRKDGALCFWTTEKAGDGRYHSGLYLPESKARSPRGTYRMEEDELSRHKFRRDAKDRALRLSLIDPDETA